MNHWRYRLSLSIAVIIIGYLNAIKASDCPVNVFLLVDSSSSIEDSSWSYQTSFIKKFLNIITFGSSSKAAFLTFNSQINQQADLTNNKDELLNIIDNTQIQEGPTDTATALEYIEQRIFDLTSHTHNRNVLMLFSDGLSNRNTDKISDQARKLHSKNLTIFALSSSNIRDEKELRSIASVPQKYHFISTDKFGEYGIDEREMARRVCEISSCADTCSDNCVRCNENCNCLECSVGSYKLSTPSKLNICIKCPENCAICDDENSCRQCSSSFYLHEDGSCKECIFNCKTCKNSFMCDECKPSFYWDTVTLRCQRCHILADLVLLVDASGSIKDKAPNESYENWDMMKSFIKNLLERISIGFNQTRVSTIKFSSEAEISFGLDDLYKREEIEQKITELKHSGGETNPSDALRLACQEVLTKGRGSRDDKQDIIIILTDGESNRGGDPKIQAEYCRNEKSVQIFGIGVTNDINMEQLQSIVSTPIATHLFNSPTFTTLQSLLTSIARVICNR